MGCTSSVPITAPSPSRSPVVGAQGVQRCKDSSLTDIDGDSSGSSGIGDDVDPFVRELISTPQEVIDSLGVETAVFFMLAARDRVGQVEPCRSAFADAAASSAVRVAVETTACGYICVGQWILLSCLGRGGSASVHLSVCRNTGAFAAVKRFVGGAAVVEAALREAALLRACSHPNILPHFQTIDCSAASRSVYIVSPLLVGGASLHSSSLSEWAPLRLRCVRVLLRGTLHGLAYLHSRGIVHRDIKPGNVFVDREGAAVIGDFGSAQHRRKSRGSIATASMDVGGATAFSTDSPALSLSPSHHGADGTVSRSRGSSVRGNDARFAVPQPAGTHVVASDSTPPSGSATRVGTAHRGAVRCSISGFAASYSSLPAPPGGQGGARRVGVGLKLGDSVFQTVVDSDSDASEDTGTLCGSPSSHFVESPRAALAHQFPHDGEGVGRLLVPTKTAVPSKLSSASVHRGSGQSRVPRQSVGTSEVPDGGALRSRRPTLTRKPPPLRAARFGVGTPAFHPPEVCTGVAPYTPAGDIFALGTTLFAWVFGRLAFNATSPDALQSQICGASSVVQSIRSTAHPYVVDFLKAVWHEDPLQRPSAIALLSHPLVSDTVPRPMCSPAPLRSPVTPASPASPRTTAFGSTLQVLDMYSEGARSPPAGAAPSILFPTKRSFTTPSHDVDDVAVVESPRTSRVSPLLGFDAVHIRASQQQSHPQLPPAGGGDGVVDAIARNAIAMRVLMSQKTVARQKRSRKGSQFPTPKLTEGMEGGNGSLDVGSVLSSGWCSARASVSIGQRAAAAVDSSVLRSCHSRSEAAPSSPACTVAWDTSTDLPRGSVVEDAAYRMSAMRGQDAIAATTARQAETGDAPALVVLSRQMAILDPVRRGGPRGDDSASGSVAVVKGTGGGSRRESSLSLRSAGSSNSLRVAARREVARPVGLLSVDPIDSRPTLDLPDSPACSPHVARVSGCDF